MQELKRHRRVVTGTQKVVGILVIDFNRGLKDVNFAACRSRNAFWDSCRVLYLFQLGTYAFNGTYEIIAGFLITSNVRNEKLWNER